MHGSAHLSIHTSGAFTVTSTFEKLVTSDSPSGTRGSVSPFYDSIKRESSATGTKADNSTSNLAKVQEISSILDTSSGRTLISSPTKKKTVSSRRPTLNKTGQTDSPPEFLTTSKKQQPVAPKLQKAPLRPLHHVNMPPLIGKRNQCPSPTKNQPLKTTDVVGKLPVKNIPKVRHPIKKNLSPNSAFAQSSVQKQSATVKGSRYAQSAGTNAKTKRESSRSEATKIPNYGSNSLIQTLNRQNKLQRASVMNTKHVSPPLINIKQTHPNQAQGLVQKRHGMSIQLHASALLHHDSGNDPHRFFIPPLQFSDASWRPLSERQKQYQTRKANKPHDRHGPILDFATQRSYYHYEIPTICTLSLYAKPEAMVPPRLSTTPFPWFRKTKLNAFNNRNV